MEFFLYLVWIAVLIIVAFTVAGWILAIVFYGFVFLLMVIITAIGSLFGKDPF
jgi:hypothetical protein